MLVDVVMGDIVFAVVRTQILVNHAQGDTILKIDVGLLLQAWVPSNHVWSNLESPGLPHFPNQEPPPKQQLRLPDSLFIPQSGHTRLVDVMMAGIVFSGVRMWILVDYTHAERERERERNKQTKKQTNKHPT